jgi:hypothetical protein
MDGTSDGGAAWAGVRGCPTPSDGEFVQATSAGTTGPDESSRPATTDFNEFIDPLRYQETISGDNPLLYLRLGNSSATAAAAYETGATPGVQGPLVGNADTAVALQSWTAQIQTTNAYAAPSQYTAEAWFSAQAGSGAGQIVGMNQSQNGSAQNDDHSLFLNSSGQVVCYYHSSGKRELVSPGSYTDDRWHLVQCAKSADGVTLDIDGARVASNTFTGAAYPYSGYWVIGRRHAGDGAQQSIVGDVAEVAIYDYALSQAQDANHYAVGKGQPSTGG